MEQGFGQENPAKLAEKLGSSEAEKAYFAGAAAHADPVQPATKRSLPWLKEYQFKPGVSGNPSGRPADGKPRKTDYRKLFREQMNERGAGVVKACLDLAEQGDIKAIGIAMKFLLPEAKSDSGSIDLDLPEGAPLEERLAALVEQISSGKVSVEAGAVAAKALRDTIEGAKTLEALSRMDTLAEKLKQLDQKDRGY